MMGFSVEVEKVLQVEAGYVNDPADSGGETIWGITKAVARAFGYVGPMVDMTRDQAKAIYRLRYWDAQSLDLVSNISPNIAAEVFDTEVNTGLGGQFLQRALNVLNQNGAMYPDIKPDGRIGPMTIAALREYLRNRQALGQVVMLRVLNGYQAKHYLELAERREKDEKFVFGWFSHRVV